MLPSATDLEYFLEVSRTLNISRAAERIGISQPTLTQSIHKLENIWILLKIFPIFFGQ
ncbi:LysR family transcriptional regulator [Bdellovibrio sp.]|uniref:helix-turn-helix domain-containing protein n=1 Tax=Bdellovibrio TaxID=958 RepID=UPI0032216AAB